MRGKPFVKTTFLLLSIIFISILFRGSRYIADNNSPLEPDSLWNNWRDESIAIIKSRALDRKFKDLNKRKRFNGVVYVEKGGHILHKAAYGYANNRSKDTLSFHTSFQLASVSKTFTAAAVMLLAQDSLIHFDDSVKKYIPNFPYENITIRNLLNHRSGMGRYDATAAKYWRHKWKEPMSNDDVVYQYGRYKPVTFFRPNRGFNYCNTNYVFLASLVEYVSGKSFGEFMQERVFDPLGMCGAVIYSRKTDPDIPNEAIGYKGWGRRLYKAPNDYIDGVYGDKGMYASLEDMLKFEAALRDTNFLKAEFLDEAIKPGGRGWKNYGFGWRLKRYKDRTLQYHFGWWRGFRSCYIRDPKHELTFIVLSNWDVPGRNLRYWDYYSYLVDEERWDF